MRRLGLGLLLLGCGGGSSGGGGKADAGSTDVVATVDVAAADDVATVLDAPWTPPPDAAEPLDASKFDSGNPLQACGTCDVGQIVGVVCAPNQQVFVNDATVWVEGTDCEGKPYHIETKSDSAGLYTLAGVPCGWQEVHVKKGSYTHDYKVVVPANGTADVTTVGKKECFKATAVKLAVITGDWDDLGGHLDGLGFKYDTYELYVGGSSWNDGGDWYGAPAIQLLTDPAKLATYQVLFINCGGVHYDIITQEPQVVQNLSDFVKNGGSLYTSDFAFVYAEWPWPDAIDFYGDDAQGEMGMGGGPIKMNGFQKVPGTIVDPALASYLGKGVMTVHFDLGPLVAVSATAESTVQHVIGYVDQFKAVQPLVMSFRPWPTGGKVLYTNFHNDEQADKDMQTILNYLVFTL